MIRRLTVLLAAILLLLLGACGDSDESSDSKSSGKSTEKPSGDESSDSKDSEDSEDSGESGMEVPGYDIEEVTAEETGLSEQLDSPAVTAISDDYQLFGVTKDGERVALMVTLRLNEAARQEPEVAKAFATGIASGDAAKITEGEDDGQAYFLVATDPPHVVAFIDDTTLLDIIGKDQAAVLEFLAAAAKAGD